MRNFYKFTLLFFISLSAKAQVPTATILSVVPYNCSGSNIFFAAKTNGSPTFFKWSLPPNRGAIVVSRDNDSSVVLRFSLSGVFTISLTVGNGTNSSVATKTITVTKSAIAAFNANLLTTGYPNQLSLTDYSTNKIKSYWLYSGTNAIDSTETVLKNYAASGSYTVTLAALGKNGCNDTVSYAFRISDSSAITLPNIFSPNDDGANDLYRPVSKGITKMNAYVFNRYGALITSWDRVNGFWDGYSSSGLPCGVGEYFIIMEATGFDGKTFKLKSSITLVR